MADNKNSWDKMVTPIGLTYGQIKRAFSGRDPENAPAPAKEHKEKAQKLSTKSGKAIKKATKNY